MKAIQIKYLGATNTQGFRLKAMAEGCKAITEPFDYALSGDEQPLRLANKFIEAMGWDCSVSGVGMLPNGDYVATIQNKKTA